jgi:cytochrome c-type biogenesis protein CcmH/NrfF
MGDKTFKAVMIALVAVPVGLFLRSAWGDAKEQAEEAANRHVRWTDEARCPTCQGWVRPAAQSKSAV